MLINMSDI